MTLSTSVERVELDLEFPFTIARGTQETAVNVVVEVVDGAGNVGRGAAAPSGRFGETAATVEATLPDLLNVVRGVDDPANLQRVHREMDEAVRGHPAAKAAVDVALHDLVATRLDVPLYRHLGLDPARTVESSYTVGMADLDGMREKAETAVERGYGTLKVKLGTGDDVAVVEAVRRAAPEATLRVDANEAWSPKEAVRTLERLAEYDVELVEQPVPAENLDGLRFVYERSPVPVAADEACRTAEDVPGLADRVDAVTLKLMKCGGIRPALAAVRTARAHGLSVMLGCMVETNLTIAAGAHLAPLLDYADLDGSLLLAEDPYSGVPMPDGRVDLSPVDAGTGAGP